VMNRHLRATMNAVATVIVAVLLSAPVAAETMPSHIHSTGACIPLRGRCQLTVMVRGAITATMADNFDRLLDGEALRSSMPVRPVVIVTSQGGDVAAAMKMGRSLRRNEGAFFTQNPAFCYSACALVAAGAVTRTAFGVGLHRPYFATSDVQTTSDADARYKSIMATVRAYLREMNMSDEVFRIMQEVGPGEIHRLTSVDARRLGFVGDDPAFEEAEIARNARRYGLSSAEYRTRQQSIIHQCGEPLDADSLEEMQARQQCVGKISARIMWGVDAAKVKLISDQIRMRCGHLPAEAERWEACYRDVGNATRDGVALPPDFQSWTDVSPPEGFEWLDNKRPK